MAFTGMHIVCSPIASSDLAGVGGVLPIGGFWAKTMAAEGGAGQVPTGGAKALIRAHTSIQGFIATSKVSAADALSKAKDANALRWLIEADSQDHDIYANAGDYIAWSPA